MIFETRPNVQVQQCVRSFAFGCRSGSDVVLRKREINCRYHDLVSFPVIKSFRSIVVGVIYVYFVTRKVTTNIDELSRHFFFWKGRVKQRRRLKFSVINLFIFIFDRQIHYAGQSNIFIF